MREKKSILYQWLCRDCRIGRISFSWIVFLLFRHVASESLGTFLSIFLWLITLLLLSSATVVSPNQAKVILFFGQYLGTIRENGFFLTIPLAQK